MSKFAIFELQGGIGKHIAFTGVLDAYKKANPDNKIIVVSAWPEIFLNNPDVERSYRIGMTPFFYRDFIYKKDVEIYTHEPYKDQNHILKKTNLIETWCNLIGVEYNNNMPKLSLNNAEQEAGKFMPQSDKPVLIFQPFGGPDRKDQALRYSWMRDIHPTIAQELVNIFSQKYHVVHICYETHPILQNCTRFDKIIPKKPLFASMLISEKRLFIDSAFQHAAAALSLPSHVVWTGTQPNIFGYDMHKNYTPILDIGAGTADSYLYDYNFIGEPHECPFDTPKVHDYDQIVKDIMST